MIGTVSYAIALVAFGLFALLLMAGEKGGEAANRNRRRLLLACGASCAWAIGLVGEFQGVVPAGLFEPLEALRDNVWIFFLLGLLQSGELDRWTTWLRRVSIAVPVAWLVAIAWDTAYGMSLGERLPFVDTIGVLGGLACGVLGLALIEQIYRNLRPDRRWALKHMVLALGGLFVYDVYFYAYALLLHAIQIDLLEARGAFNALAVPLLAVSVSRSRNWSGELFISQRAAFHTAALMGAGLYLLAMAAGGYYVQQAGGTWGQFNEIIFLTGAAIVLMVVLFSGQARAYARVFLNKHFFAYKYDYRDEWLRLTDQLYTDKMYSNPYQRSIVAVADIVDSPGGAVWIRGHGQDYEPAAVHNMQIPSSCSLPPDAPLAAFMRKKRSIIDLRQRSKDRGRYESLILPDWIQRLKAAWLIVPLRHESNLSGFMVIADARAPVELSWEDDELLKAVGQQIGGFLAHHEDATALSEARQFEAYTRITTFLMHDLKNIMAQQSLLVKNAENHKANPAFIDDMIATVEHSVNKLGKVLEQLRRAGTGQEFAEKIDVVALANNLARRLSNRRPQPTVEVDYPDVKVRAELPALTMVIQHVLANAQDATPADGRVTLRIGRRSGRALIEIEDTGSGMDANFIRERLFRPFYTTKSSKGMGIGAYQAREFARASGGDVDVASVPGQGTRFRIWLPDATESQAAADLDLMS